MVNRKTKAASKLLDKNRQPLTDPYEQPEWPILIRGYDNIIGHIASGQLAMLTLPCLVYSMLNKKAACKL